ncbi:hypothetical protein H0H93_012609, partial [Arthromyces matolae]
MPNLTIAVSMSALVDARNPIAASPQLVSTGPKSKPTPQNYRPGTGWEPDLNPPGWDDCIPRVPLQETIVTNGLPYIGKVITLLRAILLLHHQVLLPWAIQQALRWNDLADRLFFKCVFGSGGVVYYSTETGNTVFSFQFGSPMVGDNYAGASPESGNPKVKVGDFDPSGNLY